MQIFRMKTDDSLRKQIPCFITLKLQLHKISRINGLFLSFRKLELFIAIYP